MDQLVVLQEIYESLSKGGDGLQKIKSRDIGGSCSSLIKKLAEGSKKGTIDEDLCQDLGSCLQDVYELKRLGDICRKAGLLDTAIKSYSKALSLGQDKNIRSVLQNNLGQAYALKGDLDKSAFYYQNSAQSFEAIGDRSGLAHVLGNMGSAYRRSKDWDKAIEHCYRSFKIFQKNGDELGAAQMTGSLGRIYAEMGERELAARYFERSLTDFQRLGDKKSAAWVLDRLGRIATERKDLDKAIGCYNQSLALFEQLGQSQSAGMVLSNLGKTYLDMNEAAFACESLERAARLIPKNDHPNYPNALSRLAISYSIIGRNRLQEAMDVGDDNESIRSSASKYYSLAADKYLELASLPRVGLAEIKATAGVAKARAYLAKLSGKVSDQEAVTLAERALLALDITAENSSGQKKSEVLRLQKTLLGMKEVWSIGFLESEPWRLQKSIAKAVDHLVEGTGGFADTEINDHLCDALNDLCASIKADGNGKHPAEYLRAASSSLLKAKDKSLAEKGEYVGQSVQRMIAAAEILEGLTQKGQDTDGSSSLPKDQINLRQEREALLNIGWILAENSLSLVDSNAAILTWDEALNLTKIPISDGHLGNVDIKELRANPSPGTSDKISKKNIVLDTSDPDIEMHDGEASIGNAKSKSLIFADGTAEASPDFVSNDAEDMNCWLIPVKASTAFKSQAQILPAEDRPRWKTEIVEPPIRRQDADAEIEDPIKVINEQVTDNEKGSEDHGDAPFRVDEKMESPDNPASVSSEQTKKGIFSTSNGILLLKAMTIVVFLLLAIEVILYLI